ncbi:hypothetical protein DFP72DRAFT_900146 [Ephemerocybe angulata]|uniref:Uncharacterized protein n=1 Tax=Ephemerocybe angulata TaxID=980116 RepID=A0A8H6M6I9_9AGAR|nr:hypothetical protein DFP72DRAFT_900146 [Tulosesus angulatus]
MHLLRLLTTILLGVFMQSVLALPISSSTSDNSNTDIHTRGFRQINAAAWAQGFAAGAPIYMAMFTPIGTIRYTLPPPTASTTLTSARATPSTTASRARNAFLTVSTPNGFNGTPTPRTRLTATGSAATQTGITSTYSLASTPSAPSPTPHATRTRVLLTAATVLATKSLDITRDEEAPQLDSLENEQ